MEFIFPFLLDPFDPCDPSNCDADVICLNDEEKREARERHLWRQDGMPSRNKKKYSKNKKGIKQNNSYSTRDCTTDDDTTRSYFPSRYGDDESVTSYFPSRHKQHTVFESETEQTYPTTGTSSRSGDSEDSDWSETEHTKFSVTSHTVHSHSVTSLKNNFGNHKRPVYSSRATYGILEEAPSEDCSVADSVGAVRIRKDNPQSAGERESNANNYAFDYIRKAANKISKPASDPPSDKSMATSRSIRAEDAGSVLLRQGIVRPKNSEILARAILKRRMQAKSKQLGPQP
eukprot:CAMPEP_0116135572 /NCGR_PEP_ID=MMETSP0329-20121206/11258_1 /TAXON_ID=697910 /ORGANISM="Pseudo-nitzschia arenysensis, Strain B593" /LENGTH=287 /DNA_ID=CAMNT_0003630373 /DNA_START=125 /DNA_END=988 /DNA_ORIENTATION=+